MLARLKRRFFGSGYSSVLDEWRALTQRQWPTPPRSDRLSHVVFVPSDPWSAVGSRGDQAMLVGAAETLRASNPGVKLSMVVATRRAASAAQAIAFQPLRIWGHHELSTLAESLAAIDADALVVVGADTMDGYYSPGVSMKMLGAADLFARQGRKALVLGFSFNANPDGEVLRMFSESTPSLTVNVRDAQSLRRFSSLAGRSAHLVADVAFLLRPDARSATYEELTRWTKGWHSRDYRVLGFNMHPMLIKPQGKENMQALVASATKAIREFMRKDSVCIAFVPHDYRGGEGDDVCLVPIFEALRTEFADRVYHPGELLSAAQLKACAGLMDGVVTGRMHLAIAALGMGVPVAALTYQDKFQGLFDHFELPPDLLMQPEAVLDPDAFLALLLSFVHRLVQLRAQVHSALPAVKLRAFQNLAPLQ